MNWKLAVERYATSDEPVLLTGETGVGKDVAARCLHADSSRTGTMVTLNCGAVPATLVEAEMFGVERGAYTGANSTRHGLVAAADRGTLFLDEIGELPLVAQATLLRFLDSGEYRRVGGSRAMQSTARIVTATNRDLVDEIRAGRFRLDLYHRLAVLKIRIPPLRERPSDIDQLLKDMAPGMRFGEAAKAKLKAHPWPGNVRELRAVLARLRARCRPGSPLLSGENEIDAADLELDDMMLPKMDGGGLKAAKRDMIQRVLAKHGGNVRAASRELGVAHATVYRALTD